MREEDTHLERVHARIAVIVCILLVLGVLLIGLIPYYLPSYTRLSRIGDGGLLSGDPCEPPCFWGIIPGQTPEERVWQILEAKGLLQQCHSHDNTSVTGFGWIGCDLPGQGFRGRLGMVEISFGSTGDTVEHVLFFPAVPIIVQDVITKYGIPTWVMAWRSGIPEYPRTEMTFFYDTVGMTLHLTNQDGMVYVLAPSKRVSYVAYFGPQAYAEYLKSLGDRIQQWRGYEEYHQVRED